MRIVWIGLGVLLAGAAGAGGWYAYETTQARDVTLSERPSRSADPAATRLEPRSSTLVLDLTVPYAAAQASLDKLADRFVEPRNGRNRIVCLTVPVAGNVCADAVWTAAVARDGPIRLARVGERLKITIPARVEGEVGVTGDVTRFLRIQPERFSGAFTISVETSFALNDRFCPALDLGEVEFDWREVLTVEALGRNTLRIGRLELPVGPVSIPVGELMTEPIRAAIAEKLGALSEDLPCDQVRGRLARLWRGWAVPIRRPEGPPLFLNVEPRTLATAPVEIADDHLRVRARLEMVAAVAPTAGSEASRGELPENEPVAIEPGRLSLALPVEAPYAVIEQKAARALRGRVFSPAGGTVRRLTIEKVELYPSGDRLTIGLDFKADLAWRFLDVSGHLWLTARPVIAEGGQRLRLTDVAIARRLDSPLWSAMSAAFVEEIRAAIERAGDIDLSRVTGPLMARVGETLADTSRTGGVRIMLDQPRLTLGRLAIGQDSLVVEGLLDAGLSGRLE